MKLTKLFVSLAILLHLCGCSVSTIDQSPPLGEAEKVALDFNRIRAYFSTNMGNIPVSSGQIIRWEDTEIYRAYFVGDYSVIQFPKRFDDNEFQLTIIDGVLDRASDYYRIITESRYPDYAYSYIHIAEEVSSD